MSMIALSSLKENSGCQLPLVILRRYERPDAAHLQDRGDRADNKGDAQDHRQDLRPAQALFRDPLNVMVNENSDADGSQITECMEASHGRHR